MRALISCVVLTAFTARAAEPPTAAAREPDFPVVSVTALGVAAVAGLVTFGVLAGIGQGERRQLETNPCAATMTCDPALVEPVRNLIIAGDVALMLGIGFAVAVLSRIVFWYLVGSQPP